MLTEADDKAECHKLKNYYVQKDIVMKDAKPNDI